MYRRSKEQEEIDKSVLNFTVTLFKIVFTSNISLSQKLDMLLLHVTENKVWFCYFLGGAVALLLLIISLF